jgi:hypothetical protein
LGLALKEDSWTSKRISLTSRSLGFLAGLSVQTLNATLNAAKLSVTKRLPWYERGYRKTKKAMYAATDLANRNGFLGWLGIAIYKTIWATMLIVICTIWLLTLGGKLIKHKESK